MSELDKLGPKPETVTIGIREPEKLSIWPLSMADQLDLSKILDKAVSAILTEAKDDLSMVMSIRKVIEDNIGVVLKMITDYDTDAKVKKLLKKVSNDQFVAICEKVYQMNYERISKNVLSLLGAVTGTLDLGRPSPASSKDTPDTDLSTSPDSPLETAD